MENIEHIFCGNEKSSYMILKMKDDEKLRIFSKNEEIFLEKEEYSCMYCSEISEILFKLTIVLNSIQFRRKEIQNIYYNLIASVICLCLTLNKTNDSNYDELKKNIDDELNYISDKLDDEIIANNKLIYFRTYIIYLVIFTLVSIITSRIFLVSDSNSISLIFNDPIFNNSTFSDSIFSDSTLIDNSNLIKILNSNKVEPGMISIIKSMYMSTLGGLIALYFKMSDKQFFKSTFLTKNYVLFSLIRGIYSTCVGIAGYYIFINFLSYLDNTKAIDESQLYIFAATLGYSTKFIPSFFNKISDKKFGKRDKK